MNYDNIQDSLDSVGVSPPDLFRAALYLTYLQDAEIFFTTTLAKDSDDDGLGAACYAFVSDALTASELLDQLAVILDTLVAPAVQGQLDEKTSPPDGYYADFFSTTILPTSQSGKDITQAQFDANVTKFYDAQSICKAALDKAYSNFTSNIKTACTRLYADRGSLKTFYADQFDDGFALQNLKSINTGTKPFYNGGQQSLELQLVVAGSPSTGSIFKPAQFGNTISVVYEPRDLEIDCLICGVSSAANSVLGEDFIAQSLFEIYNKGVSDNQDPVLAKTLKPLPTLLILPVNPSSKAEKPVVGSYGYRQSLTTPWLSLTERAEPTTLTADALIGPDDDATSITSDYYLTLGAMTALSTTFSITELTSANIVSTQRIPTAANTNASLVQSIETIATAGLVSGAGISGGIDGQASALAVLSINAEKSGLASVTQDYRDPNRLWQGSKSGTAAVVPLKPNDTTAPSPTALLVQGFDAGTAILKAIYTGDSKASITGFIKRADKVVVKIVAISAASLSELKTKVFTTLPAQRSQLSLEDACNTTVSASLSTAYTAYKTAADTKADPAFIALSPLLAGKALMELDDPTLFHQIGTPDLLGADGTKIAIPTTITTYPDPKTPKTTGTLNVKGAEGMPDRDTYFAQAPSAARVFKPQVETIGTSAGDLWTAKIRASIFTSLGLASDFDPTAVVAQGKDSS
ncbi:MAG: hypothetical protein ACRBBS_07240 [Thalassovita sp.]